MAEARAKETKDDKPAKPLRIVKNEEDAPAASASMEPATASQKTLATALSRAIVISAVIGSLAFASVGLFGARYELVRGSNTDNNFVYRLDRLTGAVRFCGQQQCTDVMTTSVPK